MKRDINNDTSLDETMAITEAEIHHRGPPRRRRSVLWCLVALTTLTACDFGVLNPGPTDDETLNGAEAYPPLVHAISRALANAYNYSMTEVAFRTRELHVASVDQWRGSNIFMHEGTTTSNPTQEPWSEAHDARFLGEEAIRRGEVIFGSDFASTALVADAHLWSGYAHRLLGNFFCEAVFDGGPKLPGVEYLTRALDRFTTAIDIATAAGADATETLMAARAGRASVRVDLGDWPGAVADAGFVPTDFEKLLLFGDEAGDRHYNPIGFADFVLARTVWNTFYWQYFLTSGDPRTPWKDNGVRFMVLQPWNRDVPWLTQTKYAAFDSPVQLSSGEEMRLIEAESALLNNDMASAMTLINALRATAGVAAWPAPANIDEAWSFLKAERGIELWLESRRMADIKRWRAAGTPGALAPEELGMGPEGGPDLSNSAVCLPIPDSESDANNNF